VSRGRLVPILVVAVCLTVAIAGVVALAGTGTSAMPTPPPSQVALVTQAPVATTPAATPGPSVETPSVTASPSVEPTLDPSVAPPPTATPPPTPTPSPAVIGTPGKHPTPKRVVVPALGIDLAVVRAPNGYPWCNVAMYFPSMGRPGTDRATYIFAHARDGMFGPIYELSMVTRQPQKMIGMRVEVYTADDRLHVYRITKVRRHVTSMDAALSVSSDTLFLQTSEGPHGTPGKTQVIAKPVSTSDSTYADAHPRVRRVACG